MTAASVWRSEVGRKAVHLAMAALPAWTYWVPEPWNWRGLVLAFFAFLTVDAIRLRSSRAHRVFDRRIGAYLRDDEAHGPIRIHELTAAAAIAAWALPPALAATAVGYAVFGDAAAALVGRRWGGGRRKSAAGSAACLAVCLAIGAALLPGEPLAVVAGAVIATAVEAMPSPADDNLAVPLVSGLVLALLCA